MMNYFLLFFLLPILQVSAANNCTAAPLSIPYTNVTLSTGFQRRGIPLQLGSPPQQFSVAVSASFNNTVLEDRAQLDLCDNTPKQCEYSKGGVYSREASSTWRSQTQQEFGGAYIDIQPFTVRGEDVLKAPSFTVPGFPFTLDQQYEPQANDQSKIGLGAGSAVLNQLVDEGRIPGRSWSLDYGYSGTEDIDEDVGGWDDGSLVLGGMDKSRYTGDLYSQDFAKNPDGTIDRECHLKVTITGMRLQNATQNFDLMKAGKSAAMIACISPQYPLITIPEKLFGDFNRAQESPYDTRTLSSFYPWAFLDRAPFYDGNMTITLSNGFTATIPNHQLVKPYRKVAPDGTPFIFNGTTNRVLTINALRKPNDKDLPMLGQPFLAAAYLVVDNDAMKFQMGRPSRQERALVDRKVAPVADDVVPILPAECLQITDGAFEGIVDSSEERVEPRKTKPDSVNIAPIAGGIAGGVLVAIGAITAFILWRRRKARANAEDKSQTWGLPTYGSNPDDYYTAGPPLEADSRAIRRSEAPVAELQAWRDFQELSGDNSWGKK